MSARIATNIVTDGLVLYLDASNLYSYPGSGNTWFDLTSNKSHFTLYNSPTYDGQSLSFIGASSQYADANSVTTGNFGSNNFTMEFLVNVTNNDYVGSVLTKRWFNALNGTFGGGGWNWRASYSGDGGPSVISDASPEVKCTTLITPPYNTLYHGCATINRSGTSVTIKTYTNNVLKETTNGTMSNTGIDNTVRKLTLMAGQQGGLYYTTGNLYMVRLYNRELTSAEVAQNYGALKSKFGL